MRKYNSIVIIYLLSLIANYSLAQSYSCLSFDGNNDYVFIGDENDLGTSNFTIEGWFFVDDIAGIGNKIVNKGVTSVGVPSNAGYALRASRDAGNIVEFQIGNSDGVMIRVIHRGIVTQKWYHVAGVRDGTKLFLYLDGVLVVKDSTETIFNVDTNIPLVIGAIHKGGLSANNEFMNGKIDEIRIWNIARTEAEIMSSKDCAITTPQTNLLAVYNLNEGEGLTIGDSSGANNGGILIDGPEWECSTVAPVCKER